jgi:hypothetical protein
VSCGLDIMYIKLNLRNLLRGFLKLSRTTREPSRIIFVCFDSEYIQVLSSAKYPDP